MRRLFLAVASFWFVALVLLARLATAQGTVAYERRELKIPMRDGVMLFAVALSPKGATAPLPILLIRTPFNAPGEHVAGVVARAWGGWVHLRRGRHPRAFRIAGELRQRRHPAGAYAVNESPAEPTKRPE